MKPRMSCRSLCLIAVAVAVSAGCASRETVDFDSRGQIMHTMVPVRFVHSLPFVDVKVNGSTVPVVFDLGCNGTLWLSPETAEACGATFTGGTSSSSDAYGNRFVARDFVLQRVNIGGFELTNVRGREFHSAPDGFDVKGILGLGALRPFRLQLDWPVNFLHVSTGPLPCDAAPAGWTQLKIKWTSYGIRAPVQVDGKTLDMIWDTGASISNLKPGRISANVETHHGTDYVRAASVIVAGREVGPMSFVVNDIAEPPGDGIMGSNFFRKHRVMIDLEAGLLAFN